MGFTRFWKQPNAIEAAAWAAIVDDVAKVLAMTDVRIVGGAGAEDGADDVAPGLPPLSDEEIAFNGAGADAAEWFVLRAATRSTFECVKTEGRPYDVLVAAVLLIAKHHAPAQILEVTSDGGTWEAWIPAVAACAAAGVAISERSIALLKADVARESPAYEPPKSDEERELDAEWARMREEQLLKAFCEARVSPKFLRYQAAVRVIMRGVKLQLRRSIDARSLPPTSPTLRQKADEIQVAWNATHRLQIVTVEIG